MPLGHISNTADKAKGKKPQEEVEGSATPKKKVTSQMLLNKFQRECNGFYREDQSYKKPRFDQRPRGPIIRERGDDRRIPVHDWLGDRVSVHDRLGGRTILRDPAGGRVPADERLEHMANARVPDDQPMRRVQKESLLMITLISLVGVQRV